MLKVALTGGIGSGKSSVCKAFEELGVKVYYADIQAKNLMLKNPLKQKLIDVFGSELFKNQEMDRAFLAQLVFNQKDLLQKLNNLVHPAVAEDYQNWLVNNKDEAFTIKEAAIVFETGTENQYDKIIVVYADDDLRLQRAAKRDGVEPEKIKERMQHQWPQDKLLAKADFKIYNKNWNDTLIQVKEVHENLLQLAENK